MICVVVHCPSHHLNKIPHTRITDALLKGRRKSVIKQYRISSDFSPFISDTFRKLSQFQNDAYIDERMGTY